MPGLLSRPSLDVQVYTSAKAVLSLALDTLEANAVNANLVLPILLKVLDAEKKGMSSNNTWMICYSSSTQSRIEYIVSCTEGSLGSYPAFIFTTKPYDALFSKDVYSDMQVICQTLEQAVGRERVYSVFAADCIAVAFAQEWTKLTGIEYYSKPYYDCTISFCSRHDLKAPRQNTLLPGIQYELCPGTKGDVPEIGQLCERFALESDPFLLVPSQGRTEALMLVENNQVWVHRIRRGDGHWEIASIVAYTRNSQKVATITKVYTNERWRKLGCAERLVRKVCRHFLCSSDSKEKVVLYVGRTNPAANVYHRVGFRGLDKNPEAVRVEGVDRWLELGFDKRFVRQGHW